LATFKVTDLMIKVLPQGLQCLVGDSGCGCSPCTDGPTPCHPSCPDNVSCACSCTNGCTGTCTGGCTVTCGATCGCTNGCSGCSAGCTSPTCGCSGCSGGCTCSGPSHQCGPESHLPLARVAQAPEDRFAGLSALKEQLKQQLAAVEKQHGAAEESLRPQTVAQVDDLQKKLEAALEELKARRTELQPKDKKPPSA
jgi:hypothetical protein